jgi:hypothetical protein
MPYPIPPWIDPSAAQGYGALAGEASRAALTAQLQRERMSQEAAQSSLEMQQRSQELAAANQAKQEQTAYDHQVDQQKNAIENAYRQQQIGLQTQDLDLAKKQFDAKTQDAAKRFTANQMFQKSMLPTDQGGEGLSATQAALKYMSPYMTGTELGRMAALPGDFKPGNTFSIPNASNESLVQVAPNRWEKFATVPQAVTNAPTALSVTDTEGKDVGHIVQIPGQKPIFRGSTSSDNKISPQVQAAINKKLGIPPEQDKPVSTMVDKPKPAKNEVIRVVNGRAAVFDSSTKQFIRWADNKAADAK